MKHLKAGQLCTIDRHVYKIEKHDKYDGPCTKCSLYPYKCTGYCLSIIPICCHFKLIK